MRGRGDTALHAACRAGQLETARLLIYEGGADVNVTSDSDGATPLMRCLEVRQPFLRCRSTFLQTRLTNLFSRHSDVQHTTRICRTIPTRLQGGHVECAKLLLDAGCNYNQPDANGHSALHWALQVRRARNAGTHTILARIRQEDASWSIVGARAGPRGCLGGGETASINPPRVICRGCNCAGVGGDCGSWAPTRCSRLPSTAT